MEAATRGTEDWVEAMKDKDDKRICQQAEYIDKSKILLTTELDDPYWQNVVILVLHFLCLSLCANIPNRSSM